MQRGIIINKTEKNDKKGLHEGREKNLRRK